MRDPSELHTILVSSIRSLFGELESHSFGMEVKPSLGLGPDNETHHQFTVECQRESVDAIRASLAMPTTPSYVSTIYRFDVIDIIDCP